jgi:Leu/Phe-tRNA-protein transferase
MTLYPLRFTRAGYVYLDAEDDCRAAARALRLYDYDDELCVSREFDPAFIANLCAAGFLVMAVYLTGENGGAGFPALLPKHHLVRSCLFFPDIHIKKTIRSRLDRYELRFNADFETIVDKCVEIHGSDWLIKPLVDSIKAMRNMKGLQAAPASFGLYRGGRLVAGEFGIIAGKVYTSYSGYYEEDNAGTIQMILTARYLEKNGFAFWDLGMPLDYKLTLGAREISRDTFMDAFFQAQSPISFLF